MTPMTVAWISDFPIEWLPDVPESVAHLPKMHPTTWELVLFEEFQKNPQLRLHIVVLRKNIERSFSFQRKNATFHILKYRGGARGPSLFWFDTWIIRRLLRKIKPDIVHAWGNERGAGLVASRLPWPYLITIQGLFTWYRETLQESSYSKLSQWSEVKSLKRSRHVTTESKFAIDYLKTRYPQLALRQAEHAPNPIFPSVVRSPAPGPIRFLTNGTVGLRKGTDIFLIALASLVNDLDFEAVIIGSEDRDFLAPFKQSLPVEFWRRVTFKTDLTPSQVAQELAYATIFILPTRADTSPNAVKEAVVAGVPVVGSNVGGIPDYVFPNLNGFLAPSGDLNAFISAIKNACAHPLFSRGAVDPETLARMRDYLSASRMVDNFLAAYHAVLADK